MDVQESVVQLITERFGREAVCICSQFHIQVRPAEDLCHNVWVNRHGAIKAQFHGQGAAHELTLKQLEGQLDSYKIEATALGKMRGMREMARVIDKALTSLEDSNCGVFVDASYNAGDGTAFISAILIFGEEVLARRKPVLADSVVEAELAAIMLGSALIQAYVEDEDQESEDRGVVSDYTIYSDNKEAVERWNEYLKNFGYDGLHAATKSCQAVWVSRRVNKAADQVASRRKDRDEGLSG